LKTLLDRVCQESQDSSLRVIHAHPNGTEVEKQKAANDLLAHWTKEENAIKQAWHGVLSNVLYLCTEQPDVSDKVLPVSRVSRLGARIRFSVPHNETVIGVGIRLGSVFRKAAGDCSEWSGGGSGIPLPPHIRRAHWHTYWVGKKGEQRPEVKWLSPILVNAKSADQIVETVHRVAP